MGCKRGSLSPGCTPVNLSGGFGSFEAVKGINFIVRRGECFGLLGPNGAGKTSVVKMIYGFSPVTSGSLEVLGRDITIGAREVKARIGVVPQEDNLDPELQRFKREVG